MKQKLIINDDISLELPKGSIGISFSGGADSSLLVYLVLNQLREETLHLFTISTIERNLSQHKITSDVLTKICYLTNNYNVVHHISIYNTNNEGIKHIRYLPQKMLHEQKSVTSILYGDNCNPPFDCGVDSIIQTEMMHKQSRSPLFTRSLQIRPGEFRPLTNLNKKDIVQLYFEQGILESVFPSTRSCGREYDVDPCGTCFFCAERTWGLTQIN
jgi:7-cyano-7-deazaguanine synthase in queuosine biosynthesis